MLVRRPAGLASLAVPAGPMGRRLGQAVACVITVLALAVMSGGCALVARGASEDSYSIAIMRPATLTPGAARTDPGLRVAGALFTGLVRYDPQTRQPVLAVAQSIESADQRHWTITIEEGWTFHNGEPVTSENFVRAWNAAAYGPNGWAGNELFTRFRGYAELNPPDPGGSGGPAGAAEPETRKLSGLQVVDDYTFRVTLAEPFSQFPFMLARPAFFPMPRVAFRNLAAFRRHPIGNGPYRITETWNRGENIELARYKNHGAGYDAAVENLTYRIYPSKGAAYRALLDGRVDILPAVPPQRFAEAQDDFGDRFVFRPGATFVYLGLPLNDERFDDPRLRRALSMAIDREEILKTFFDEVHTPAESLISPVAPDAREGPCGVWCGYHPQRARELFEAAGGYDGTLHLWYPGRAAERAWMGGLARMLRQNLGIEVELHGRPAVRSGAAPGEAGTDRTGRATTGPWLDRWAPSYLGPQAYLQPLYTSGGDANRTGYRSDRVDVLVGKGNRADTVDAGLDRYHHAEDIVLGDMPVVPLWFQDVNAAHSRSVRGVLLDGFGHIRVARVHES